MATSSEVLRSNEHRNPPQISTVSPEDDIRTIMLNEVSWGAVFAGAIIALVMQVILNMIGVGVGLSTIDVAQGDSPTAGSLSMGAGIWWVVSGIVAAAIGGYLAGETFRQGIAVNDRLSRSDCMGGRDACRCVSGIVSGFGTDRGRLEHGIVCHWWCWQSGGRINSDCCPGGGPR